MSCPPLFQPIRFLAACTLDRFVFQLPYLMFAVGMGYCSVSTVFLYAYW